MTDLKNINIGPLVEVKWKERAISMERTCNFLKCTEEDINKMFEARSLDSDMLMRWSKLLGYDFFRLYSQHLIFYSPQYSENRRSANSTLPQFRKNIYTKEIIDFILELVESGKKTKQEVILDYRIPKTTLYKWIKKYSKIKV